MESPMLSMLVFTSILLFLTIAQSYSVNTTMLSKCHEAERSALLEFKTTLYNGSCDYSPPYSNLTTWTLEGKNGDCCKWDGVECDEHSGRVVGLDLPSSCLSGSINSNSSIFKLLYLQSLDLSDNHYLMLTLRDLTQTLVKLEVLTLSWLNISSSIPDSISRLSSLKSLRLDRCGLQGHIPTSIGNLVSLELLDLTGNHLVGPIPCLQKLANLTQLSLGGNNLVGDISTSSFWNLTQLQVLDLSLNNFTGEIFPPLISCIGLWDVRLSFNKLYGQIPKTISLPRNISYLSLDSNNFSGKLYLDVFYKLKHLSRLDLSHNKFSHIVEPTIESPELEALGLASCNLRGFPKFLRNHQYLIYIDLSSNNISGEVPKWFFNVSIHYLQCLNISHNHLTGFVGLSYWKGLSTLDLSFNQFKGSLPSPSTNATIWNYLVSNNEFSREIPTWMCDLEHLNMLDLSNNNLTGEIPLCFRDLVNFGRLLQLSLKSNNFSGRIPPFGKDRCYLEMIDMSYNQLEGLVPRDIENCINLEFLNLGNNRIDDVFPFWLGKLPTLQVLILDSNRFHGIIEKPDGDYHFPKLQIISLSRNKFIGSLPSRYFLSWSAMKVDADKEGQLQYWKALIAEYEFGYYYYSFRMNNKGRQMDYKKIQKSLVVIDLSNNNFTGEIPKSIGTLKGLYSLILSNNMLTGSIPFNLNSLTNLESLDLSHNKLSSEIPQSLTDLTSLSFFDVSFNQLTGPIPISKQFNTFDTSSYQGNPGLCGLPLSRKCGKSIGPSPPPSLVQDTSSKTWIEINWKFICMGYASGFVIGVTIRMTWTKRM